LGTDAAHGAIKQMRAIEDRDDHADQVTILQGESPKSSPNNLSCRPLPCPPETTPRPLRIIPR
jgi:hypothetical protein